MTSLPPQTTSAPRGPRRPQRSPQSTGTPASAWLLQATPQQRHLPFPNSTTTEPLPCLYLDSVKPRDPTSAPPHFSFYSHVVQPHAPLGCPHNPPCPPLSRPGVLPPVPPLLIPSRCQAPCSHHSAPPQPLPPSCCPASCSPPVPPQPPLTSTLSPRAPTSAPHNPPPPHAVQPRAPPLVPQPPYPTCPSLVLHQCPTTPLAPRCVKPRAPTSAPTKPPSDMTQIMYLFQEFVRHVEQLFSTLCTAISDLHNQLLPEAATLSLPSFGLTQAGSPPCSLPVRPAAPAPSPALSSRHVVAQPVYPPQATPAPVLSPPGLPSRPDDSTPGHPSSADMPAPKAHPSTSGVHMYPTGQPEISLIHYNG
ncbi:vegetative cell wall protein gp1-like [Homarus americanus]|uniref:vegetative cell wall protein gp1-like n=1 Tax=Homarus americanus TaxID=6706 RepID=UPI001C47238B|nr:vegetative cell wall protein gp1-like [Homarus americanus]